MADPHSLLVDEVREQVDALLTAELNSDRIIEKQWPEPKVDRWAHDLIVVRWGQADANVFSNVADKVGYTIAVVLVIQGDDPDALGQVLSKFARKIRRRLQHAADGASPLSINPLPITGGDLLVEEACFIRIDFAPTQQVTAPKAEGTFRGSVGVPMVVTLQEVAHA